MEFPDYEDSTLTQGKRYNLSSLQLDENEMNEHLNRVFANDTDESRSYFGEESKDDVHILLFSHNRLKTLPQALIRFTNLRMIDISNNQLTHLDDCLVSLKNLVKLVARNNFLDDNSFPKDFGTMLTLEEINLSGNRCTTIPPQILELENLRFLMMGANQVNVLPGTVRHLQKLQVLYLGGNVLTEVPAEVGCLQNLESLILCENQLESLPPTISHLKKLRSLALHKNCLTTLPPEIVTLQGLKELSLRDNPLVGRFVRDMIYDPPTLLELAARCIKQRNVTVPQNMLPPNLEVYLRSAQRCVNPRCKGVYFDLCVQHIKFVDFCGKYRIPLLQYLCSPKCRTYPAVYSSDSDFSEDDVQVPASKLKKVLLG